LDASSVKETLEHLRDAIPRRSNDIIVEPTITPPMRKKEEIPPETSPECPETLIDGSPFEEHWRLAGGEIREILSIALGSASISRIPNANLAPEPSALRAAHIETAKSQIDKAGTLEGMVNGTKKSIVDAMMHTAAADHVEGSNAHHDAYHTPKKRNDEEEEEEEGSFRLEGCAKAFSETKADEDDVSSTAFIVQSLRRKATDAIKLTTDANDDDDEKKREKTSDDEDPCTELLRPFVETKEVREVLTPEEETDFVQSACMWFRRQRKKKGTTTTTISANATCARVEDAVRGLGKLVRRRSRLRDYDCEKEEGPETSKCNGVGVCKCGGRCFCPSGYTGIDCSVKTCGDAGCGLHGFCFHGTCRCARGWIGEKCSVRDCPMGEDESRCSGHGVCSFPKKKTAAAERKAEAEELKDAVNEAEDAPAVFTAEYAKKSDKTRTTSAVCLCAPGWNGERCEIRTCPFGISSAGTPEMCSGRGTCDESTGTCTCDLDLDGAASRFEGDACEKCVSTEHMSCAARKDDTASADDAMFAAAASSATSIRSSCVCHDGYFGVCCDRVGCPNGCSGHGQCDADAGVCSCDDGFFGPDCKSQRPTCDGQGCGDDGGVCVPTNAKDGTCRCPPGRTGDHCERPDCGNFLKCLGRGTCREDGTCACDPGFEGESCEKSVEIDTECSGRCGDHCAHFGDCAYGVAADERPLGPDFAGPMRALPKSEDEEDEEEASELALLEVSTKKTVACYWSCMRQCVLEDCLNVAPKARPIVPEKKTVDFDPNRKATDAEMAEATEPYDDEAESRRMRWRKHEAEDVAKIAEDFKDADPDAQAIFDRAKNVSDHLSKTFEDMAEREREAIQKAEIAARAAAAAQKSIDSLGA